MKIWFDKNKINFNKFCSEQFLIIEFFDKKILNECNDFKNCENWLKAISNIVTFTTLEDCDFILFPEKLNMKILNYIELSKKYNKKIIAFYNDDNDKPTALDSNILLFRTSFNRSLKKENEYAMPAFSRDFNDYISFFPREKNTLPTVGFCGFKSHPLRHICFEELEKNKKIQKNFLIRDMFWGGKIHDKDLRLQYARNIFESDLTLCVRGAGNFSYRFYECLSAGRVPIFINSDCILPCEDQLEWKKICIYVDKPENLNDAIDYFWNRISNEEYKTLQKRIRDTYLNYISPAGFASYLNIFLKNKI